MATTFDMSKISELLAKTGRGENLTSAEIAVLAEFWTQNGQAINQVQSAVRKAGIVTVSPRQLDTLKDIADMIAFHQVNILWSQASFQNQVDRWNKLAVEIKQPTVSNRTELLALAKKFPAELAQAWVGVAGDKESKGLLGGEARAMSGWGDAIRKARQSSANLDGAK